MTPAYQDQIIDSDGTTWSVKQVKRWTKAFSAENHALFFAMGSVSAVYEPGSGDPVTVTAMIDDGPTVAQSFPGMDPEYRPGRARYAKISILDPDDSTQAWDLWCSSNERGGGFRG